MPPDRKFVAKTKQIQQHSCQLVCAFLRKSNNFKVKVSESVILHDAKPPSLQEIQQQNEENITVENYFPLNIINGCYGRPSLLPPFWFLTLCSYVPSIALNTTSLWSILKDCHSHGGWRGKILTFSVMFFLLFHTKGSRQKCTVDPRGFLPHE